jgi:hypothetical protein
VGVIGTILILSGLAAIIFHRPLTRLLVWSYGRHASKYPILYPGPLKRLVQDPKWIRWMVFTVGFAWTAIGVVELAASFD